MMINSSGSQAGVAPPPPTLERIDLQSLRPGSWIDVETKSRHYRIECLGGNRVRISGHPEYCPTPVPAHLHGAINNEGELEFGQIGRGMKMMLFLNGDHPITTSRVVSLHVDQPPATPLPSSPSIH